MSEETKTHYRKAFKSPYLSSADLTEPTVLIISYVKLEPDKTKRSTELFNTAYFTDKEIRKGEPLKPMILNVGNSEIIRDRVGSKYIDDWSNVPVTVYIKEGVKFGRNTVDGLRVHPEPPAVRRTLERGTQQWDNAIVAYQRDGNLDKVKARVDVKSEDEAEIKRLANVS